jgi:CHAT domain-containing protein/tetratricopeptide (TPR) repeat protein
VTGLDSCHRWRQSPQQRLEHANQLFLRGSLKQSQSEARQGYQDYRASGAEWAWQFRILEAKAALWRGLYSEVFEVLQGVPDSRPEFSIPKLTLLGIANVRTHNFPQALRLLGEGAQLCTTSDLASCGYLIQARGLLASEMGQSESAENFYQASLAFARAHGDKFLEANSLLNLGAESLTLGRFDEAIDRSDDAHAIAEKLGARIPALVTQGNMGWAFYKLGDSERALNEFRAALNSAVEVDDLFDQENELTNIGYIYLDHGQFDMAASSFHRALDIARGIKATQDVYNTLRVLARLHLQLGQLDHATQSADEAIRIAQESGVQVDELYPRLVLGQIAAQRGRPQEAEDIFRQVEKDEACPVFLKWEAEHSLARLFEDTKRQDKADREYRAALATFEKARQEVRRESSQLSFLTNGWSIYDDYIHFLVESGRSEEALRWADYSRARTLAEGLGLLSGKNGGVAPPLHPQEIARGVRGTLLFYWLGDKQSYLWTISSRTVALTRLPPGAEIDAAARRYWTTLSGLQTGSPLADPDGQWLYRTLIAPLRHSLGQDTRIFVIPDGNLNSVNFETLIVPDPLPHFWIEDATIVSASSLRMLAASHRAEPASKNLLLIGDSVAPNSKYPELPKAAAQVQAVAAHFSSPQERVITRDQATPQAYLDAKPEQYSYIHFVAHGTASRLSPLDSAIILSKSTGEDDSFKLYARDIIRRPLRARLVTISACYGAGTRSYSGEGLVGLSWAFLRAGAHDVIAALWEASDTPTEQLMAKFYDELNRGSIPSIALRTAKLSLLHHSAFTSPFYWAPFQLYTQGRPGSPRDPSDLHSEKATLAQKRPRQLRRSPLLFLADALPAQADRDRKHVGVEVGSVGVVIAAFDIDSHRLADAVGESAAEVVPTAADRVGRQCLSWIHEAGKPGCTCDPPQLPCWLTHCALGQKLATRLDETLIPSRTADRVDSQLPLEGHLIEQVQRR